MVPERNVMSEIKGFRSNFDWDVWPEIFPVCATHKHDFFADYAKAVVRKKEFCVLCHPRENDSLGG